MKGHVGLLEHVHLGPECLLLILEGLVGLARLVKAVVLGQKYLTLTASKAECKQNVRLLWPWLTVQVAKHWSAELLIKCMRPAECACGTESEPMPAIVAMHPAMLKCEYLFI